MQHRLTICASIQKLRDLVAEISISLDNGSVTEFVDIIEELQCRADSMENGLLKRKSAMVIQENNLRLKDLEIESLQQLNAQNLAEIAELEKELAYIKAEYF